MKYLNLLLLSVLIISCEKIIDIDLNASDPKLVIEGFITDENKPATVILSRSVNFNQSNEFPKVSSALVIVKDNIGNTDTLTEKSAGLYESNQLVGVKGRTYFLTLTLGSNTYYSQSTIQNKINLDTAYVEVEKNVQDKKTYRVIPSFQDPVNEKNFYRFVLSINGIRKGGQFVLADRLLNGVKFNSGLPFNLTDIEIKKGDVFTLEMQCLDEKLFNYFRTSTSISFGRNQAAPDNALTNIVGDAFGYFGAFTVQRFDIVIPE